MKQFIVEANHLVDGYGMHPVGELIRCKDCKNWVCGFIDDQDIFTPPHCGKYQQMVGHSADDHCSLAERKEHETAGKTKTVC